MKTALRISRDPGLSGELTRDAAGGLALRPPDRAGTEAGALTFADEALDVEVLVLDAQHLTPANISTRAAQDGRAGRLLRGTGGSLGLRHCQGKAAR